MSHSQLEFEPASFRDRHGRVFYSAGCVFRSLSEQALRNWQRLRATRFFGRFLSEGKLVHTQLVDSPQGLKNTDNGNSATVLKHEKIPFVSYPYEWSFGMLKDAALLQLELVEAALEEDMILKDCSSFNIQWKGTKPVFIDILSFEPLIPGTPWVGYRQFCQLFLYPLFLQAYKGVAFHAWLRGNIDGLEPQEFRRLLSARDLFRAGVFRDVYLHSKLQERHGGTTRNLKTDLRRAGFNKHLIHANVKRLTRIINGLTWEPKRSHWSEYAREHCYTAADQAAKNAFVRRVIEARPWRLVWDLGCNVGTFSRTAGANADYVVAIDLDPLAINRLYYTLKANGNTSILPLVSNVANPSPNLGWRGLERKALLERGKPDLTLCLALIHHVAITSNIPVKEFLEWLAQLETAIVIEFVTKQDPMVQKLLRNKEDQYSDYNLDTFESSLAGAFYVRRREVLSGTRFLYFATPRTSSF